MEWIGGVTEVAPALGSTLSSLLDDDGLDFAESKCAVCGGIARAPVLDISKGVAPFTVCPLCAHENEALTTMKPPMLKSIGGSM